MVCSIGKAAPHFVAKAVQGNKVLPEFSLGECLGHYVVFFFYPLDFTFVCPTEIHAFQDRLAEFEKRNAVVVGCSVDSHFSHLAWLEKPKKEGGIAGVTFPIVADIHKTIARDYGVLCTSEGVAFRGVFLIDKEGIVRHQTINDLPIGRSIDEELRTLDALIFHEKHGEVCPANWAEGQRALTADNEGLRSYFTPE